MLSISILDTIDDENMINWTGDPRWSILQRAVQNEAAARAFTFFREIGIEPILIKGAAALRNYPEGHVRPSVDIDLAVAPSQYLTAERLLDESVDDRHAVDLHRGLRHLDTVDWEDLFINSITFDVNGIPVRILRPEDHLRLLSVHWLTDGGGYKIRLWDIYYAVSNRPPDFDWDRCLNIVSANRRRWVICVIGLTHKYLDLPIDDLPFADEAKDIPRWLINAVEKEWASDVRIARMGIYLRDPKTLIKQIKKRIPPDPIQATVVMEGSFDAPSRIGYQFWSIFKRLGGTKMRLIQSAKRRAK